MPNTEVKLLNAESSWWETACEGRTLPFLWRISSAGRASALQAGGHRFEPCILHSESLAQSVEHLTFNQRVDGSSPSRLMAPFFAGVAELADALDLGSSVFGRVGSSPTTRIRQYYYHIYIMPI